MEPVSIIGLAGSLVGITDVVARSLKSLINLQSKYRSSNLVVSLIIGQLTTINAALNQITEWVTGSLATIPLHGQLVADLQVSLESCYILILVIEERIEALEQEQDSGNLTLKGKVGFLLEEGGLNEFTNLLNNQINALNLLITALHCANSETASRTTFERNKVLSNDESRKILQRVEDNKTSLLSLRDDGSQHTRFSAITENWSLLEKEFDFDQEVITTDVYRAVLRSNMKRMAGSSKAKMPLRNEGPFRSDGSFMIVPERVEEGVEEDQKEEVQMPVEIYSLTEQSSYYLGITDEIRDSSSIERKQIEEDRVMVKRVTHAQSEPIANHLKPKSAEEEKQIPSMEQRRKNRLSWSFRVPKSLVIPRGLVRKESIRSDDEPNPCKIEAKVLLLGSSSSGKTTLFKSILYQVCNVYLSVDERLSYKEIIISNAVESMRVILETMDLNQVQMDATLTYHVQTVLMQPYDKPWEYLPAEVYDAIEALWRDPRLKQAFERSQEYRSNDSAAYVNIGLKRYLDPKYIPSDQDIIMARIKTTGINKTKLNFNGIEANLYDIGGTRSERKKWIHVFDNVNAIVFVVDIAAGGQVCECGANRTLEDIALFDSIVNSKWFLHTHFILLFTKVDKLKTELRIAPIKRFFPDFEGDETSIEDVKTYMERRFLELNKVSGRHVEVMFASFFYNPKLCGQKVLDRLSKLLPNRDD